MFPNQRLNIPNITPSDPRYPHTTSTPLHHTTKYLKYLVILWYQSDTKYLQFVLIYKNWTYSIHTLTTAHYLWNLWEQQYSARWASDCLSKEEKNWFVSQRAKE